MEITLTIQLAPALQDAITNLCSALQSGNIFTMPPPEAPATKTIRKPRTTAMETASVASPAAIEERPAEVVNEQPAAHETATAKTYTLIEVRALAASKSSQKDAVWEAIKACGGTALTNVPEDRYPELVTLLQAIEI